MDCRAARQAQSAKPSSFWRIELALETCDCKLLEDRCARPLRSLVLQPKRPRSVRAAPAFARTRSARAQRTQRGRSSSARSCPDRGISVRGAAWLTICRSCSSSPTSRRCFDVTRERLTGSSYSASCQKSCRSLDDLDGHVMSCWIGSRVESAVEGNAAKDAERPTPVASGSRPRRRGGVTSIWIIPERTQRGRHCEHSGPHPSSRSRG